MSTNQNHVALQCVAALLKDVEQHQAIVADCLLWFDGFRAATRDKHHTPEREDLRRLNGQLQEIISALKNVPQKDLPF